MAYNYNGDPVVDIFETAKDEKKRRNRLAQRKHRDKMVSTASSETTQKVEPGESSNVDWTARTGFTPSAPHPSAKSRANTDFPLQQFRAASSSELAGNFLTWDWNGVGGLSTTFPNDTLAMTSTPTDQAESCLVPTQYYTGSDIVPLDNANALLNSDTRQSLSPSSILEERGRHDNGHPNILPHLQRQSTLLATQAISSTQNIDGNALDSIESRIEQVLEVVSELRFANIDTLISSYFRESFQEASLANWAQTASIARGTVARLAESHYARELQRYPRVQQYDSTTKAMRDLCSQPSTTEQLKRAKLYLREQVPEAWALLSSLTHSVDMSEPQASQAICVFLGLLGLSI